MCGHTSLFPLLWHLIQYTEWTCSGKAAWATFAPFIWGAESNKKISWGFFSLRALNATLGIRSYPWLLLIVSLRSKSHLHSIFQKWPPIRWSSCFKYPKWDIETILLEQWHSLLQLELWSDMESGTCGDVSGQKCLQSGLKNKKIFLLLFLRASAPPQ